MTLIEHLENGLGPIMRGWGEAGQVKVAEFHDRPLDGVSTYSTIGFSHHPLQVTSESNKLVRAELLFSAYPEFSGDEIASVLLSFVEYLIAQDQALLRGDVVGPSGALVSKSSMRAVYASIPVFFDDEFSVYPMSEPNTVFIWLIPMYASGANYVKRFGWECFEEQLEVLDVDYWNLRRPSIPLDQDPV